MLTDEQRRKGYLALLPNLDDEEHRKHHALQLHKKAMCSMDLYGLPYRVSLDQFKKYDGEYRKKYCLLNPQYPYPGYNRDDVPVVLADNFDTSKMDKDDNGVITGELFPFKALTGSSREIVTEYIGFVKPWSINGDKWKYYFLHFLVGYDFTTFKEFDFYGTSNKQNKNDIALLRGYYERLQIEYLENQQNYMQSEPLLSDYNGRYIDQPYIVSFDDEERAELEKLEKQLNIYKGD